MLKQSDKLNICTHTYDPLVSFNWLLFNSERFRSMLNICTHMILWCHLIGYNSILKGSAPCWIFSHIWFCFNYSDVIYLFPVETMLKIWSIEYLLTSDSHFFSSQPNFFSGQRWPCFQMLQHDYNVQQAIKMQTCDFWFCQNIIFWADLIHNCRFLHQKPEISISDRGRHGSGYQCRHLLERYR